MQSDALTPAGFSINHYNSGRISGEWGRRNGVLRFLWTYFFVMRANFSCRRVDGGQLLMRECQLLCDVFGRGFQRSNRIFFPAGIFIDRSFISVNVRGMLLGVVSGQWSVGSGAKPAMAMGPFACSALREKGDRYAGGRRKETGTAEGCGFGVVFFLLPVVRILLYLV